MSRQNRIRMNITWRVLGERREAEQQGVKIDKDEEKGINASGLFLVVLTK